MAKRRRAGPTADADRRVKTSLVIPEALLHRLKVAAAEEREAEGVSGLLCRIAEAWLSARKGGRR